MQDLLNETTLPVVGRKTDVDKRTRARSVAARYESHRVHHHRSLKGGELEAEMLNFPKGHDDQIDALGLAMDIRAVSGSFAAVAGPSQGVTEAQADSGVMLRFNNGSQIVPAYLAKMLEGIEVERFTREEAVAMANRKTEAAYINNAIFGRFNR